MYTTNNVKYVRFTNKAHVSFKPLAYFAVEYSIEEDSEFRVTGLKNKPLFMLLHLKKV